MQKYELFGKLYLFFMKFFYNNYDKKQEHKFKCHKIKSNKQFQILQSWAVMFRGRRSAIFQPFSIFSRHFQHFRAIFFARSFRLLVGGRIELATPSIPRHLLVHVWEGLLAQGDPIPYLESENDHLLVFLPDIKLVCYKLSFCQNS
jgi:hypothetical protein